MSNEPKNEHAQKLRSLAKPENMARTPEQARANAKAGWTKEARAKRLESALKRKGGRSSGGKGEI